MKTQEKQTKWRGKNLDLRLLPPALAVWLISALILLEALSKGLIIAVIAAGAALSMMMFWRWKKPPGRHRETSSGHVYLLVGLSAVAVACAGLVSALALNQSENDPVTAQIGNRVRLTLTLTTGSVPGKFGYRATAQVDEICGYHGCAQGLGEIEVRGKKGFQNLVAGQRLQFWAELKPGYGNLRASVTAGAGMKTLPAENFWQRALISARQKMRQASAHKLAENTSGSSSPVTGRWAALVPGLALGDRGLMNPDQQVVMKQSSLTHLTAVSGSHTAIFLGAVMWVGGFLPRRWRVGLGLAVLGGFIVVVGPSASVLRSGMMASIVLLGQWHGRAGMGLPALAASVIFLILLDPWQALDLGFGLSVMATAALLLAAPRLTKTLSHYLPRWLATALAIALAAQISTLPLVALLSPGVPWAGLVANLLAAPAVAPAVLASLAATFCEVFLPFLAPLFWALAHYPCWWIFEVAVLVCAYLPQVPWLQGPVGAASITLVASLLIYVIWLKQPGKRLRNWWRERKRKRYDQQARPVASEIMEG